MMATRALAARALCAVCALAPQVTAPRAYADTAIPDGSIGFVTGITMGVGNQRDAIKPGARYGMEAAWQPMSLGQRFGLGIHWTATGTYHFGIAQTAGGVGGGTPLQTFSSEVTLRLRMALGNRGFYGHVGGGGGMYRSNLALPPDETQSYIGGTAELGAVFLFTRRGYATANFVLGGMPAPTTASVMLGMSLAL